MSFGEQAAHPSHDLLRQALLGVQSSASRETERSPSIGRPRGPGSAASPTGLWSLLDPLRARSQTDSRHSFLMLGRHFGRALQGRGGLRERYTGGAHITGGVLGPGV